MKVVEMHTGDTLSDRAEGEGALQARLGGCSGGWAPRLPQAGPGLGPHACLDGARGGPGGRRQSALPGCGVTDEREEVLESDTGVGEGQC